MVMIPMFVSSRMSLSLLPHEVSGSQGHLQARQERGLLLQRRDDRPRFWDKASYRKRRLLEQRHQDKVPAPAKDTHQPQACGMPHPRLPGDQGGDVRHRAGRHRLLRLAPDAQQPQGSDRHGQPQACRPFGLRHRGALPLPARALRDLEALLTPGSHAIPAGRTGLRRQVCQDQPWIFVTRLPARQQRAMELAMAAFEGAAGPLPGGARLGHQRLQGHSTHLSLGTAGSPVLMRKKGCQPRRVMRRNSQRAYKPRSASTRTVHARGTARCTWRSMRNHSRRQACLAVAGRTVQATGMAQPRYTTRSAKTVKRVPKVVASRARANGVPSHWATTQASQGTKQGSTGSAQRAVPRLAVASEQNARNCWRTGGSLRCNHVARNALTAVNAQERARTMPRLHSASTVAWGLLKWGRWVWMVSVHSVTRGWQDIEVLLRSMGYTQPPLPCPMEGCLVTSSMMSYRHLSKNLPQKGERGELAHNGNSPGQPGGEHEWMAVVPLPPIS